MESLARRAFLGPGAPSGGEGRGLFSLVRAGGQQSADEMAGRSPQRGTSCSHEARALCLSCLLEMFGFSWGDP